MLLDVSEGGSGSGDRVTLDVTVRAREVGRVSPDLEPRASDLGDVLAAVRISLPNLLGGGESLKAEIAR